MGIPRAEEQTFERGRTQAVQEPQETALQAETGQQTGEEY